MKDDSALKAHVASARDGLVGALSFAPGVTVLGVIFGASTGAVGISGPAAILMSALVFSGAGQFAALPLWSQGGGVVILTTLALSLRFALITSSLAPLLAGQARWLRAILAYAITDENYALAIVYGSQSRRSSAPGEARQAVGAPATLTGRSARLAAYLAGAWTPLYAGWFLGTVVGVLVGAAIPPVWIGPLKSVFPLVFLSLTVLLCTSVPLALVAVLGASLSVLGALAGPPGWNVILAGLAASLAGPLLQRLLERARAGKQALRPSEVRAGGKT